MLPPPTKRQLTILHFLERWIDANAGTSPTFRELAEFADLQSVRTVTEHVHSLRRKHLVTNVPGEARTLFLTPLGVIALAKFRASTDAP